MSKRELTEYEKLEGIGDIGEVPEAGVEVEEAEHDCFCGFDADEEVEIIEVDDIEDADEELLEEPEQITEEPEKE